MVNNPILSLTTSAMVSISVPTHYNTPAVEEESSCPCIEYEVPRELLLHRSKLIPPLVLGFERFEENKYTSIKRRRMIVQCKEEDVEKNG